MAWQINECGLSYGVLSIWRLLCPSVFFPFLPDAPGTLRYRQIDRYWFRALDYILWEQVVDKTSSRQSFDNLLADVKLEAGNVEAIKAYRFRRNRSIEHLHPQNPPQDQETKEWLEDRDQKKDLVRDSFGNLAMISSSFNSAQGNDSIAVKFGRVQDSKNLESIKMLLMFRAANGKKEGWTPVAAEEHGNKMFDLLKSVYTISSAK